MNSGMPRSGGAATTGRAKTQRLPGDRPKTARLNRQTGLMMGMVVILAFLPLALGDSNYTMRLLVVSMIWGGVAIAWVFIARVRRYLQSGPDRVFRHRCLRVRDDV